MSPRPRRDGAARRRVLGDEGPADDLSAFKRKTGSPAVADEPAADEQSATPGSRAPDATTAPAPRPQTSETTPGRALPSVTKPAQAAATTTDDPAAFDEDDDAPPYVRFLEGALRQANYSVPPVVERRLRGLRTELGVEYPQAQVLRGLIAMRFPVESTADLRPELMQFQAVARKAAQAGERSVTMNIPLRSTMLDEIDRLNGQTRAGKSGPPRRRSLIVGAILWAAAGRSETEPDALRADLERFDLYEHLALTL